MCGGSSPEDTCLLAALPVGEVDLDQLPDELTRALFEALRLEIHYDKTTNQDVCRITLTSHTVSSAAQTARDAVATPLPGTDRKDNPAMPDCLSCPSHPFASFAVPPTGFEPVLPP